MTRPLQPMIAVQVHCFEAIINDREFLIEVCAVAANRWRAHLVRVPGGSTALMPFYGSTPEEAASELSNWLARAHGALNPPVPLDTTRKLLDPLGGFGQRPPRRPTAR